MSNLRRYAEILSINSGIKCLIVKFLLRGPKSRIRFWISLSLVESPEPIEPLSTSHGWVTDTNWIENIPPDIVCSASLNIVAAPGRQVSVFTEVKASSSSLRNFVDLVFDE